MPEVVEAPSEEPPPTSPGVDSDIPENAALYFRVGSRWQGYGESTPFQNWGGCELATTPSPVPGSPATLNCSVTIPEGQLYYSDIEFKMGTRFPEYCPVISFRPYYYRRSDAAISSVDHDNDPDTPNQESGGYIPPGSETPIDCSGLAKTKECWGGAAPAFVEKFPENTGYMTVTAGKLQQKWVVKSENELRTYGGEDVNYLITNDLNVADRAATVTDTSESKERVGGTFRDYRVSCNNYWAEELYSLRIIISDENMDGAESGTAHDNYPDWN